MSMFHERQEHIPYKADTVYEDDSDMRRQYEEVESLSSRPYAPVHLHGSIRMQKMKRVGKGKRKKKMKQIKHALVIININAVQDVCRSSGMRMIS